MGIVLEPGGFVDLEDSFRLGHISGWVSSGWVAVDQLPGWYAERRVAKVEAKQKAVRDKHESRKLEVEVGVMTATVDSGKDDEFGTGDDKVTIKPKTRSRRKKAKK